ncbi:MAG: hypothetical protein QJR02_08140 [Sinobacteraceae bacterium]|nr:hypothetical protein [Nevskiaceae bacterium]
MPSSIAARDWLPSQSGCRLLCHGRAPRHRHHARQVQGKELSYNNLNDADAAFECVAGTTPLRRHRQAHSNPCGVASAPPRSPGHGMSRTPSVTAAAVS